MTVAQLITKLQSIPNQSATVLVDLPSYDAAKQMFVAPPDTMGEPLIVATGIGWKIINQRETQGYWVGAQPWEWQFAGMPNSGVPCAYIGSGDGIIEVAWNKIS